MMSDSPQEKPSGATHEPRIPLAHSTPPQSPPLPWLEWVPGERVVLRYRLHDGLHDALGLLRETAVDHVVIDTRRGPVRVEASTMVTGKKVPPAPPIHAPVRRENTDGKVGPHTTPSSPTP